MNVPPMEPVPCSDARDDRVDCIVKSLAFFSSVVKSGEDWSDHCQSKYESAIAAVASLAIQIDRYNSDRKLIEGQLAAVIKDRDAWERAYQAVLDHSKYDPKKERLF